jgi:hypothetical protein
VSAPIHINLDDLGQVEALCLANQIARTKCLSVTQAAQLLADLIRQLRSAEDIADDNACAQQDYEAERRYGWSVR